MMMRKAHNQQNEEERRRRETGELAKKMRFSQTGDHSQENLAKFGYRSGMKIKNIFTSFLFFWLLAGTCCRNLVTLFYFFSQNLVNYRLESFFSQKSVVFVENIIFQV
jgi:hypothetical protein